MVQCAIDGGILGPESTPENPYRGDLCRVHERLFPWVLLRATVRPGSYMLHLHSGETFAFQRAFLEGHYVRIRLADTTLAPVALKTVPAILEVRVEGIEWCGYLGLPKADDIPG